MSDFRTLLPLRVAPPVASRRKNVTSSVSSFTPSMMSPLPADRVDIKFGAIWGRKKTTQAERAARVALLATGVAAGGGLMMPGQAHGQTPQYVRAGYPTQALLQDMPIPPEAQRAIDYALAEGSKGINEDNPRGREHIRSQYMNNRPLAEVESDTNFLYCVDFALATYARSGTPLPVPHNPYTLGLMEWVQQTKPEMWIPRDQLPQRGDIFITERGETAGHAGLVVRVDYDARKIYTVEGNVGNSGAVEQREHDFDWVHYGYIRMFPGVAAPVAEAPVADAAPTEEAAPEQSGSQPPQQRRSPLERLFGSGSGIPSAPAEAPPLVEALPPTIQGAPSAPAFVSPVGGISMEQLIGGITSPFGSRELNGETEGHNGLDFGNRSLGFNESNPGPLVAMVSGTVQFNPKSDGNGAGNRVHLVSDDGSVRISYFHMTDDVRVQTGQHVNAGDLLGFIGHTGRSTAPHLHLEIRENERLVDPEDFIRGQSDLPYQGQRFRLNQPVESGSPSQAPTSGPPVGVAPAPAEVPNVVPYTPRVSPGERLGLGDPRTAAVLPPTTQLPPREESGPFAGAWRAVTSLFSADMPPESAQPLQSIEPGNGRRSPAERLNISGIPAVAPAESAPSNDAPAAPLGVVPAGYAKNWMADGIFQDNVPAEIREEFLRRTLDMANRLGINPDYTMGIMRWESGFRPYIQNSSSTRATGLIQFTEGSLPQLNNNGDLDRLARLSHFEQLPLVEEYFERKLPGSRDERARMTLTDLYLEVFYPVASGQRDFVFPDKVRRYNPSFDNEGDRNGVLSYRDIDSLIFDRYNQVPDL